MKVAEVLTAYVESYFDGVAALSYDDLPNWQDGFFASLAYGAAGIGYACWYAGSVLADSAFLEEAERWVGAPAGREHERLAFLVPLSELRERPASHFFYGEAGLAFVRVLVAHARKNEPARAAALARFLDVSRLSKEGSLELYNGTAGCLAGAAILARYTGEPRLQRLVEELSSHLIERAAPGEDGAVVWPELQGRLGLSHGSSGPYLALLLGSIAAGSPLPEWFAPSLQSLLGVADRDPLRLCAKESHHSMLCNGFTGLAFLGARAHQALGGEALLTAASGAARRALDSLSDQPDLCCGRTGVAFACLALSRADPQGPWWQYAQDLMLSTLLCAREEWSSAGLFSGEAAIACLALNLTAGISSGPPGLDLLELPATAPPPGPG